MTEIAITAGLGCVPIEWPHPRGANWIVLCNPENENRVVELKDRANELRVRGKLDQLPGRLAQSDQALSELTTRPNLKMGIGLRRFLRRVARFK
jgi:hypothetical protein